MHSQCQERRKWLKECSQNHENGDSNSMRLDSLNELLWLGSSFRLAKESLGSLPQFFNWLISMVNSSFFSSLESALHLGLALKVSEVSAGAQPLSLTS